MVGKSVKKNKSFICYSLVLKLNRTRLQCTAQLIFILKIGTVGPITHTILYLDSTLVTYY